MRNTIIGVVAIGFMAVGAGCTSSSDTAKPSTASSSTTQPAPQYSADPAFLEAGNAICAEMKTAVGTLSEQYDPTDPTSPEAQAYLTTSADLIQGSVDQLRALAQPAGDEDQLEAMYANLELLISYTRQLGAAQNTGDQQLFEEIAAKGDPISEQTNADLTAYGLTECGGG